MKEVAALSEFFVSIKTIGNEENNVVNIEYILISLTNANWLNVNNADTKVWRKWNKYSYGKKEFLRSLIIKFYNRTLVAVCTNFISLFNSSLYEIREPFHKSLQLIILINLSKHQTVYAYRIKSCKKTTSTCICCKQRNQLKSSISATKKICI